MRAWVYLLFFASGFTGLLYQIVWIRAAGTVLGNTTHAVGTVVGVYMGGMALGAWLGGRAADRRGGGALLRLYGLLEAGVALSALLVPWLLSATAPIFRALWDGSGQPGAAYGALRVAVPALILALPTTLMGATLPVLAKYFTRSVEGAAGEAGKAYALNTFGGVAGTLAAGFWLVPAFGLMLTTLIAVLANAAIAAAALAMARGAAAPAPASLIPPAPLPRMILWVAAMSGLAGLIYEVGWTRMIVLSLGSTVYSFTLVLAVFIFGLAAGSALGARWVHKAASPERALAVVQLAVGAAALLALPFLSRLPLHMASLMESLRKDFGGLLLAQAGLITLLILPPTLLMGAVFPFACRAVSGGEDQVGRGVAGVYTWNTLGSILGTFLATFLIVPTAGPGVAVKTGVLANMAAAALLLWKAGPASRGLIALPAAVAVAAFFSGGLKTEILSVGAYIDGHRVLRNARESGMDMAAHLEKYMKVMDAQWDAYGLVTVHGAPGTPRTLRINGKVDASTNGPDMATQRRLAHLPLLHHPSVKKALVIGLGAGITAGTAGEYELERVDCVELSPAVARMARHFADVNARVLDNPKVRLTVGDGRHFVRCSRERYDVIICEPSNLWLSGMATLFTRDFFQEAAARLAPGGILCQWVHAYRLPEDDFRSVLRTFFSVFPGGGVWEVIPGGDYLLLGRAETGPLAAWPDFKRRVEKAVETSPDLADAFVPPAVALASTFVADAETVRRACGPGDLLTDDHCRVEYSAPRSMHTEHRDKILGWLDGVREGPLEEKVYGGLEGEEKARVAARRAARRDVGRSEKLYTRPPAGEPDPGRFDPRGPDALRALDEAIRKHGPDRPSRVRLEAHAQEVLNEGMLSGKAGQREVAAAYLEAIPKGTGPYSDARTQLAIFKAEKGDMAGARKSYLEALEVAPRSLSATVGWALSCQALGRDEEALEAWTRAGALDVRNPMLLMGKAGALHRLKRDAEAKAACLEVLRLKPDERSARDLLNRIELGGSR